MTNSFLRALVACVAVALLFPLLPAPRSSGSAEAASTRVERTVSQIKVYRRATWRLQELMGRERTPTFHAERRSHDTEYLQWVRDLWKRRAARARRQAERPPHREAWQCIHRYERHPAQGWRTHTGNGYYGGLQMDIHFQRAYGPELLRRRGTANNWRWFEQMWVAERAYASGRGFYPWPNTARYCGLI